MLPLLSAGSSTPLAEFYRQVCAAATKLSLLHAGSRIMHSVQKCKSVRTASQIHALMLECMDEICAPKTCLSAAMHNTAQYWQVQT
jgi:hypothetical protein